MAETICLGFFCWEEAMHPLYFCQVSFKTLKNIRLKFILTSQFTIDFLRTGVYIAHN